MSKVKANLNVFTKLLPDGNYSNANKAAFQTSKYSDRTQAAIINSMNILTKLAEDPNYPGIEYGKPFYLPCVLTRASEVSEADVVVDGIMQADGSVVATGLEAPQASEEDQPF